MELTLKCRAIANYIIEKINEYNKDKPFKEQVFLHDKKLQKLLYFCEIEYMKENNGKTLFDDEYYAWPSGPVIVEIYTQYIQLKDGKMKTAYEKNEPTLSKDIKLIIDKILELTKDLDTIDLVNISKLPDSPYDKVYDGSDIHHNQKISKKDIYLYYKDKVLFSPSKREEQTTKSLYQDEIIKLDDTTLQLQYMLGGLYPHGNYNCDKYWGCDIKCPTLPVPKDENLQKVMNFIKKHNISNATFIRLTRSYLHGTINPYLGDYGTFFNELDRTIMGYNFKKTDYESIPENDLKEKELLRLIVKEAYVEGTKLNKFLTKYSLTPIDFMILAKTSINYQFKIIRGFEITDLSNDLKEILKENDLYQSYEWVKTYRENLEKKKVKKLIKRNKNN